MTHRRRKEGKEMTGRGGMGKRKRTGGRLRDRRGKIGKRDNRERWMGIGRRKT